MIDPDNKYTVMQNVQYSKGTSDHLEHNNNQDYWEILLSPISDINNKGKVALDFGCGKGRNIENLKSYRFDRIDGVDISISNVLYCKERFPTYDIYKNNGVDLSTLRSCEYDFVISTIVLQHIPVYDIRYLLLKEIYRVMKEGAIFSFQMGFGDVIESIHSDYFDNNYDASGTNGIHDVQITKEEDLINDLKRIGFNNIKTKVVKSFSDNAHTHWIYTIGEK